ncbi:MAG: cell division protein FtsZ [Verrucomicrobiota bacterium]
MIELPRIAQSATADLRIKILGVGGAGIHLLERLQRDGVQSADLVAIDTNSQALAHSNAPVKVLLGASVTQGLGTGGDPELGYRAAEDAMEQIHSAIEGANLVFLCTALGGGTGSGTAALIAAYAREQQALVIVFATMPFGFEGRRRMTQAEETLATLENYADLLVCFENNKMAAFVTAGTEISEAFSMADLILSQSIRAIMALVRRRGLIHAGFAHVAAAVRARNARSLFGYGEADGSHRALNALERALQSPLMDQGRLLAEVQSVLIHVAAGRNLTLDELQFLMDGFNRHIGDQTQILFSAAVEPILGERLTVTILSALGEPKPSATVPLRLVPAHLEIRKAAAPAPLAVEPYEPFPAVSQEIKVRAIPSVVAEESPETMAAARLPEPAGAQFEPATRGRFEKSEPTIVDGQDLDVPTFLRRNIRPR